MGGWREMFPKYLAEFVAPLAETDEDAADDAEAAPAEPEEASS